MLPALLVSTVDDHVNRGLVFECGENVSVEGVFAPCNDDENGCFWLCAAEDLVGRVSTAEALERVRHSPGLEDVWQIHYVAQAGPENNSAEQFIDRAASRSSFSGKAYRVRCPGRSEQDAAGWFRDQLQRLRGSAKPAP